MDGASRIATQLKLPLNPGMRSDGNSTVTVTHRDGQGGAVQGRRRGLK